VVEPPAVVDTK